jgi:hypothetical protein
MPDCLPTLYKLLAPGGFIGISTWASLPWYPLLARCIAQVEGSPYIPSAAEIEAKFFGQHAWSSPDYIGQKLTDAGFEKVEHTVQTRQAKVGTPVMFVESMKFPMMLIAGFWEEGRREEWKEEVARVMEMELEKEVGKEGRVEMGFEGLCGWGWKGE